MTIDEMLIEVTRLDAEATPGPWANGDVEAEDDLTVYDASDGQRGAIAVCMLSAEDPAFIACARTFLPALASKVRELRASLRTIDVELDHAGAPTGPEDGSGVYTADGRVIALGAGFVEGREGARRMGARRDGNGQGRDPLRSQGGGPHRRHGAPTWWRRATSGDEVRRLLAHPAAGTREGGKVMACPECGEADCDGPCSDCGMLICAGEMHEGLCCATGMSRFDREEMRDEREREAREDEGD